MAERTHPSQADEALRQITIPSSATDAHSVLTTIADRLTTERPTHLMTEAGRLALALRYASAEYGAGEGAEELEREVLRYMPRVDRSISRGEYALLIRSATKGATR
ncbi:hypothetical protein ABZS93_11590 [Streptomyces sp900116325]|uniref:hypothetical protein n=1 Tax=Streptomyces sp. 900116325 TaxID=3154295 RepID=UPI0033B84E09